MPLSKALIATAAVGFGITVTAGPALAANSQPRKVYPSNTSSVKGAPSKHKKNPSAEPS